MAYENLRRKYPKYAGIANDGDFLNAVHQGEFPNAPESSFAQAASMIEKEGSTAGASGEQNGKPPSQGGVPAIPLTTPGDVAMAVPRFAWQGFVKPMATNISNVPRGLFMDPVRQIVENRPATPEEEKRSWSGLAGLVDLVAAPGVGKLAEGAAAIPEAAPKVARIGARVLSDAGAGTVLGATNSAISSGGDVEQTRQGAAGGAFFGPAGGYIGRKIFGQGGNPVESLRTVGGRIASAGRPGQVMAERLNRSVQEGLIGAGKPSADLVEAGFSKLNATEDEMLGDALRGRISTTLLSPRAKAVYDVIDKWRNDVASRATGLKVMVTRAGKKVPFAARANHFPELVADVDAPEKVVSAMVKNAVKEGRYKDETTARAAWNDYVQFAKSRGNKAGDLIAQKMVDSGQAKNMAEARGKLLRFSARAKTNRNPSLEHARELDLGFYDPSPSRVLPGHIEGTERRLAQIKNLGQEQELLGRNLERIKDPEERDLIAHLARVAMGTNEKGDRSLEAILEAGRKAALFKFSPFTTVKNIGQSTNTLMAADLPSFLKGTAKAFTKGGKRLALESGAASESAIHNVEHEVGSDKGLASKFLNVIGFSPVERLINRRIAPNVGAEMAKKYAGQLGKNPANAFAANELRKLGLSPERVAAAGLSHDDVLRAALDLTHRTQFRSHALDLPAMANESNLGRATAQFKTFGYQHGHFIADEIAGRFASGVPGDRARALRNLAILGTVYPMTGEAINDVIALAKGEKRKTKGLARWAENIGATGGVGVAGDLASSLEYGRGDRGGTLAKTMGPPSAAIAYEATQMLADIKARQDSGKPLTPYQKKWLARQIPGAGPIIAARMKGEKK